MSPRVDVVRDLVELTPDQWGSAHEARADHTTFPGHRVRDSAAKHAGVHVGECESERPG